MLARDAGGPVACARDAGQNLFEQLVDCERFPHDATDQAAVSEVAQHQVVRRGDDDGPAEESGVAALELAHDLEPIPLRQHQVENHGVVMLAAEPVQRRISVRCCLDCEAALAKMARIRA